MSHLCYLLYYFFINIQEKDRHDTKQKWLKQATWTTLFIVTAFLICYVPYWSVCFEFLLIYIKHYYYKQKVAILLVLHKST